ncbi:MAG: HypC/HybG/HupF family hydrogenase formation chaperone [Actinomycetota bacterium]|nr:HypC/HybG/HupF family hydrogenase formation chaperone [Actinomycetota bacterium]
MCLAIPAKIIKINKRTAMAETLGVKKEIDISLVPAVRIGDFVIIHAGFAIQIIEKEDAVSIQNYWKEYLDEKQH